MINDEQKIAWVFGYLKANFDIFMEQGANPNMLSDTLQILTINVLGLLGVKDLALIDKTIEELDAIDMELAVRKSLRDGEEKSNGKKFTAVF